MLCLHIKAWMVGIGESFSRKRKKPLLVDFHSAVGKEIDMPIFSEQLMLCLPIKAWTVEIGE